MPIRWLAPLALFSLAVPFASAQTARPIVKSVSPVGAQRGTTVDVSLAGTFVGTGSRLLIDDPHLIVEKLTPQPPAAGAKNPEGTLVARLRIADDAPLRRYALRVVTAAGVTNPAYLTVGQYPETPEKEPNNTPDQAQPVSGPITVVGRSDAAEDVDVYKLSLRKGETVVVELAAGSLGSPLQPILALRDRRGFEVATAAALRTPDAVLHFTAPEAGDYLLSHRDLLYRGGGEYVYRMTVGAIPWVTSVFPAGGTAGSETALTYTGYNLPEKGAVRVSLPKAPSDDPWNLAAPVSGSLANQIALEVGALPETIEVEPNGSAQVAQPITPPVTVNGRVQPSVRADEDADYFRFRATKGQAFALELFAARIGSPLDAVLSVHDATGKELAAADDSRGRDPLFTFTAPADGEYLARVRDLNRAGGPEAVYRLRIDRTRPDFRLDFAPDAPLVPAGGRIPLVVTVERRFGFNEAIRLEVSGLPSGVQVLGEPTVPAGQSSVTLILAADPAAVTEAMPFSVRGSATIEGVTVAREGRGLQETYSKNGEQLVRNTAPVPFPAASVAGKPDIVVETGGDRIQVAPGATVELLVKVQRADGFAAKVPVVLLGLPAGVSGSAEVAEKAGEVKLSIKAEGNAPLGEHRIVVVGRVVVDELHFTDQAALPVTLVIAK